MRWDGHTREGNFMTVDCVIDVASEGGDKGEMPWLIWTGGGW